MVKKTGPAKGALQIMVIAERQRLRGLFDFCAEVPLLRLKVASTIDEGLKAATGKPPAVVFVQDRLGGLSAEIIARHLHQELKGFRLYLLAEGDYPSSGGRALFTAIDATVPDQELAKEVQWLVHSMLPGAKKKPRPKKQTPPPTPAPELITSPPDHDMPGEAPEAEVDDLVVIGGPRPADPVNGESAPALPSSPPPELNFRESLDRALASTSPAGEARSIAGSDQSVERRQDLQPESPAPRGAKKRGKGWIILAVALLSGSAGLYLQCHGPAPVKQSGELERPPAMAPAPWNETSTPPLPPGTETAPVQRPGIKEKELNPPAFISYRVRRGDTLMTILTDRFGLSASMAERLIPEILEKNGLTRQTVLKIGQQILIPSAVTIKLQPSGKK